MDFATAIDLCRTFPGVTEDIKWECVRVFSVGEKMFAITHADRPNLDLGFKVDDDRFLELTDRPGIIPSPDLARAKWVQVKEDRALSDAEVAELLRRSYELVFAKLTRKLQREIRGE